MNCRTSQRLLVDFLEESLSNRKRRLMQQHLNSCPNCREELEELGSLREEVRLSKAPERTEAEWASFQQALMQKVAESVPSRLARPSARLIIAAAAVACAVVVLMLFRLPASKHQQESAPTVSTAEAGAGQAHPFEPAETGSGKEKTFLARAALSEQERVELTDAAGEALPDETSDAIEGISGNSFYDVSLYDELDDLSPQECDEVLQKLEAI